MALSNYRLIVAPSIEMLTQLVNTAIAGGEQPLGAPFTTRDAQFAQAMVTGTP